MKKVMKTESACRAWSELQATGDRESIRPCRGVAGGEDAEDSGHELECRAEDAGSVMQGTREPL